MHAKYFTLLEGFKIFEKNLKKTTNVIFVNVNMLQVDIEITPIDDFSKVFLKK